MLRIRVKENLHANATGSKKMPSSFKSLLVIVPEEIELDQNQILEFAKEYAILPKKITLVVLSNKELEAVPSLIENRINLNRNAINFWGIYPYEWKTLFKQSFDLMINYFDQNNLFANYVSSSCQAKLRIGFAQADQRINDILFDFKPSQMKQFLTECKPYLKALLTTKK